MSLAIIRAGGPREGAQDVRGVWRKRRLRPALTQPLQARLFSKSFTNNLFNLVVMICLLSASEAGIVIIPILQIKKQAAG